MISDQDLHRFVEKFKVPEEALTYLDRMVNPIETRLVLSAGETPLTVEGVQHDLDLTAEEAAKALEQAFQRGVLTREGEDEPYSYTPADFYTRMDYMATYEEGWDELPVEYRKALDEWMMGEYISRVRPNVDLLMAGRPAQGSPGNDSVVLLEETYSIIDSAKTIIVVPCNCRRIAQNCSRPVETCIQFDSVAEKKLARGHGRRLTAKEAKDLVRMADRKGLMHTTDLQKRDGGPAPICNCCADDCYPFRAAERLGSKGAWPRGRYVATFDHDKCQMCGACTKRCHFGAFYHDGTMVEIAGLQVRNVAFDADKCWGCGLCTAVCFPEAIKLVPLPAGIAAAES